MNTEKEKWITGILSSADKLPQVQADAALFNPIKARLKGQVRAVKNLPVQTVWLAAASLALLIAVNVAILSFNRGGNSLSEQPPATEAYSLNNSFQLY